MSEERFIKIENHLENHDKDIHSIAGSLSDISQQMKRTNDILQHSALKDERFSSRIDVLEAKIMARLDKSDEAISRVKERMGDMESDKSWIVKLVLGFVVLAVLGAYIKTASLIS